MRFDGVSAEAKANVYFGGKVVSHTIHLPGGARKTLGLVFPGEFHFGTEQAERMEITDGACAVRLDGSDATRTYAAGEAFEVPARSGFLIRVDAGICQYVCSFLGR